MSDAVQARATGQILTRLRSEAGVTQATVAQNLTVSPARVSRIESGEVELTQDEVAEYLRVLGTDKAAAFGTYLAQPWEHLPRPDFEHPDLHAIRDAEGFPRINGLRTPDLKNAFAKQLDLFEARIRQHAEYLRSTNHGVAFLGSIGVGKSTAICTLAGLRLVGPEQLNQQMALEVGGGGTTVCEVRIQRGPRLGLSITPRSDDAIRADVTDFCEYLIARRPSRRQPLRTPTSACRGRRSVSYKMSKLTVISKKEEDSKSAFGPTPRRSWSTRSQMSRLSRSRS